MTYEKRLKKISLLVFTVIIVLVNVIYVYGQPSADQLLTQERLKEMQEDGDINIQSAGTVRDPDTGDIYNAYVQLDAHGEILKRYYLRTGQRESTGEQQTPTQSTLVICDSWLGGCQSTRDRTPLNCESQMAAGICSDNEGNIYDRNTLALRGTRLNENTIHVTSPMEGLPRGVYNTRNGRVYLYDETKKSEVPSEFIVRGVIAGTPSPNGAFTFHPLNNDEVTHFINFNGRPVKNLDETNAEVGTHIFVDGYGGYYDTFDRHYLGNGEMTWEDGGKTYFAQAIPAGIGIESTPVAYDTCTRLGSRAWLCSDDGKWYSCSGDQATDCSSAKQREEVDPDEIGAKAMWMLQFGNFLEDLESFTRGLSFPSLFYEGTPDWWFELGDTFSSALAGRDGWSSLMCRAPISDAETVAISFSEGVENAFAHIQGERLTVINYTSQEPNTFYLYKISTQVNPGSRIQGCNLRFAFRISDSSVLANQGYAGRTTPLFVDDDGNEFIFDLERGNGSIAYIGENMIFFESRRLYNTVSIFFEKIEPANCMIGLKSEDSLSAGIINLGEDEVKVDENKCSGPKQIFYPSCWGGYSTPQESSAQEQQQQASLNSNT